MNGTWLDFERPIVELERRIQDLQEFATGENIEVREEIARLEKRAERLKREIYSKLSRWQRVQLARHPRRPYSLDYIKFITEEFVEIHGDRSFADDKAIVTGLARIDGQSVVIIGQQKGRNTKENLYRNFGMPHPEGYRKALRAMELAAKFNKPIITLVDTTGAYPGIGAEERGQSEAIARNLREMAALPVPFIAVVIGEGGSGGALAIAMGNVVLMLENAVYSVISPEGCAAILWNDRSKAPQAAEALKLTAQDIETLGVIDEIIPEPLGGAHRDLEWTAGRVKEAILRHLAALSRFQPEELIRMRCARYRKIGTHLDDIEREEKHVQ